MRAVIHIVDKQHPNFIHAIVAQFREDILGDFVPGFRIDFTGGHVDHIFTDKPADQIKIIDKDRLNSSLGQLFQRARGHLGAGRGNHFLGLGIDQITHQFAAL